MRRVEFDRKVCFKYKKGGALEEKIENAVKKFDSLESISISTPRLIYLFKKSEKEFLKEFSEYADVMSELLYDTPAHSFRSKTYHLKFLSNRSTPLERAEIKKKHLDILQRQKELRDKIIEQLEEERKNQVLQNTPITQVSSPGLTRTTGSTEGLSAVTRDIISTPTFFGSPISRHASDIARSSTTPTFPF